MYCKEKYIQYTMMNHNEKEYKNVYIFTHRHIYIYMNTHTHIYKLSTTSFIYVLINGVL